VLTQNFDIGTAQVRNAHLMLLRSLDEEWFVEDVPPLWRLLGLTPRSSTTAETAAGEAA